MFLIPILCSKKTIVTPKYGYINQQINKICVFVLSYFFCIYFLYFIDVGCP